MADDKPDKLNGGQRSNPYAHPNSPAGGSGPGFSRPPGFSSSSPSSLPHQDSPAGRQSEWLKDLRSINLEERITKGLEDLDSASTWDGLMRPAKIFLSEKSFDLGVCYGLVENAAEMVGSLLGLAKTFVLASLYDAAHLPPSAASSVIAPGPAILIRLEAKVVDMFFGPELKSAYDEREALLRDLRKAISNPGTLLSGMATSIADNYKSKWSRAQKLLVGQPSLSANFQAGKICGEVLFDILMLISAVADAARLAKLLSEVPALVRSSKVLREFAATASKVAKDETGGSFKIGKVAEEGKGAKTAGKAAETSSAAPGMPRAKNPDTTVIGHYPEYVKMADELEANRFAVPEQVWNRMTETERWEANRQYLDAAMAKSDKIVLATPIETMRKGSYFERELEYLYAHGYRLSDDGTAMIKRY